ncbi:hypothetical protein KIN20_032132, partial [Parelaphostrongylus tenuis]
MALNTTMLQVQRILDRFTSDDGTYIYHVKWVGRPISTDPENFIKEEDMKCPELIRRFELNEMQKQKQRLKKYKEENRRKRQRNLVNTKQAARSKTSTVVGYDNVCSATFIIYYPMFFDFLFLGGRGASQSTAQAPHQMCDDVRDSGEEKTETMLYLPGPVLENVTTSHADQGQEANNSRNNDEVGIALSSILFIVSKHFAALCMIISFYRKSYIKEFVNISAVIEHPVTSEVLGIVVFKHPRNGKYFAQYIPVREIGDNVPM